MSDKLDGIASIIKLIQEVNKAEQGDKDVMDFLCGLQKDINEMGKSLFNPVIGVFAKTRFTALHSWPDAPVSHEFLRQPHRHEFHVIVWAQVSGTDREIEFIDLKEKVTAYCRENFEGRNLKGTSCEMIALQILKEFNQLYCVEVSEDGENGSIVSRR